MTTTGEAHHIPDVYWSLYDEGDPRVMALIIELVLLRRETEELRALVAELQQSKYAKKSERSTSNESKPKEPKNPNGNKGSSIDRELQAKYKPDTEEEGAELPSDVLPAHLPREVIRLDDLPEGANPDDYYVVQTKVSERLAVNPQIFYVIRTERTVYKHKKTGAFFVPELPPHPLGRCRIDVSLLVWIVVQKCLYHAPLYRQEQMLKLYGIHVPRNSLSRWVIELSVLLQPIVNALEKAVKAADVVYCDESPSLVKIYQTEPGSAKKEAQSKDKKKVKTGYKQTYYWALVALDVGVWFK
jgi:transposase